MICEQLRHEENRTVATVMWKDCSAHMPYISSHSESHAKWQVKATLPSSSSERQRCNALPTPWWISAVKREFQMFSESSVSAEQEEEPSSKRVHIAGG